MSWFKNSKVYPFVKVTDNLHEARHALSALVHHVEGTKPLSSLEIDQYKHLICEAVALVR